ncbi:DUF6541 family protein [Microbacterium sp. M28]|uniref:DUF6541 family protein n=1 Tax=Microbacterium sp. M28 TaxID=2962064 RepID=UPI002990541F|nr:DUF6541 family protein [Microbacterium sp. M28]
MALLVVPGLPTAFFAPVRGVLRLGVAVATSVAIIVAASIVAPLVGITWSVVPVVIVAIVVSLIAGAFWFLGRHRRVGEASQKSGWTWGSVALAFVGWTVVVAYAISDPSHPSQLYDGIFHINAAEFIVQTGDASPFHMTMAYPGREASFYPTAWHALVSLVLPLTESAVVATNVVSVISIALIWPVALATFASVLFPRYAYAGVWAPLVAFGFSAFPLGFLNWGVLYPNLLGDLLLPLFLAFVLLACRRGIDVFSRGLLILISIAAAGATAMGHPSALLAGIVLLVPFAFTTMWRAGRQGSARVRAILIAAAGVAIIVLVLIWREANVTTHEWLPSMSFAQAAGEVAFLSPVGRATGLLVGVLAAIGIYRVVKDRLWWVLWMHAIAAMFFLFAAWMPVLSVRSAVVGIWYDDTTRVAALLAVTGLPLAALGASVVTEWLGALYRAKRRALLAFALVGLIALAATHLVALKNDLSFARGVAFRFDVASQGLTPDEAALFAKADAIVGEDSVIIGDPLTGAGLFLAYTGRDVVFPHVGGQYGADARLLSQEMVEGGPEVCEAAERLGVEYVFDFGDRLIFEEYRDPFDGLHGFSDSSDFTEVARVGDAALYELSGCTP